MIYIIIAIVCFIGGFVTGVKHVVVNHAEYRELFLDYARLGKNKQSTNTIVYVEYADGRFFAYSDKHTYLCDAVDQETLLDKLTEKFPGTITIRSET